MGYFERNRTRGIRVAWNDQNTDTLEQDAELQTPQDGDKESYCITSDGYPRYKLGGCGFGGGSK